MEIVDWSDNIRTKKKWEDTGLLDNTPEDRKDSVVNSMNYTLELLSTNSIQYIMPDYSITSESNGLTLTSKDLQSIEGLFIPLILRVVNKIDITNDDIRSIYNDFIFDYYIALRKYESHDKYEYPIDFEATYVDRYAWGVIEIFKLKNKQI